MLIGTKVFGGMQPSEDPRLLSDSFAQVARNAKLTNGTLRAWRVPINVATLAKPLIKRSIYRFGQTSIDHAEYWLHWNSDVRVVRGAVAGDTQERTYFTGDGVPKVTDGGLVVSGGGDLYPNASYTLGIPAPLVAPNAIASGSGSGVVETRAYGYTYVSAWGEEGPLSPTVQVNWQSGQSIDLSALGSAPPPGAYNITTKRLYRSVTGTQAALFQLVEELPIATSSYEDTKTTAQLEDELQSATWFPPVSSLQGLTGMANGIIAGFTGNDVYFCEPYRPHAWPPGYRQPTDHRIVGMGAFGSSLLVCTTSNPYLMSGVVPEAISAAKLELKQACVSPQSIVEMAGGVLYASPDGLVLADGAGIRVVTADIISVDEWRSYEPASIHAYQLDGRYFAFFDNGARRGGLVFDFSGTGASLWELSLYTSAAYNENLTDSLYIVSADGNNVQRWDAGGSLLPYTWRSKIWQLSRATNFGWGQVLAEAYPLSMRVYADGVLRHIQDVVSGAPFRLPGGFVAREWEFELEGVPTVQSAFLAHSTAELQAV